MRRGVGMVAICAVVSTAVCLSAALAWASSALVPSRKPGQWEMRMTAGNAPEVVLQMCVDEATDKEMMDASLSIVTAICPMPIWSRDGRSIVILADCQVSTGRTVISRAELSGDFQSEYIFKVNTKSGLGAASDIEHRYTWVGKTCSDGLLPGVVKLPNGGKMKLKQMMKLIENINGN
jgi:hypothetical protein